ncbi:uncharacterized protein si:ch211-76l23.4 [Carcharodon carcharias]|uniref:uncharacterized protein si:ch211-76l23.4 n=1 Tax=Carcharodon carcharias TaxID=13397 RepID=UPI001B7EB9D5|nr:uncharacterized protein si:ch211-76l23.4 [Carcharodon carcharias]XP_041063066.1 uncharacterized protein si:ch211-76l23.4 [Carcharodon carcharias]
MVLRLCVFFLFLLPVIHGKKHGQTGEWNYKDGSDKVNVRGVANLTQVLDNWRFDILTQMRDILTNDHQSFLPDYSRIAPLSEALGDLFNEFNALKERLGDLTEKFSALEVTVDGMKAKSAAPNSLSPHGPNGMTPRQKLNPPKRKVPVPRKKKIPQQ